MAFLKSQRKRAMRVRTSEKTAKRIIDYVPIEKLSWVMVHRVSHHSVKRVKKNAEKIGNVWAEMGCFPFT